MPDQAGNPTPEEIENYFQAQARTGNGSYAVSENAGNFNWPDKDDLAKSKEHDSLYGSPFAPNATPGIAYNYTVPLEGVTAWRERPNLRTPPGTVKALNTQEDADQIRTQALASERSAMAKLGWDPGLSVSTPPRNPPVYADIRGMYNRNVAAPTPYSMSWHDQTAPAAGMHESMHRAFDLLRQKGYSIPDKSQEELYVRALMNRAYGDVETKQYIPPGKMMPKSGKGYQEIQAGKNLASPVVDQLEDMAANEIARKHPGGPR